jgi:hypothetical protein
MVTVSGQIASTAKPAFLVRERTEAFGAIYDAACLVAME